MARAGLRYCTKTFVAMSLPRPTPAELEILRVLWRQGPCTVRQVQEAMHDDQPDEPGYTTVLKLLQIMTEKGLVLRDTSARSHVYAAASAQAETERELLGELMQRVFGGSAARLVLRALSGGVSAEERAEIRALLDQTESDDPAQRGEEP